MLIEKKKKFCLSLPIKIIALYPIPHSKNDTIAYPLKREWYFF